MTTFAQAWNAAFAAQPPDVGQAINQGPLRIRAHKLAVKERMEVDHSWDYVNDLTDHGKHKQLTLMEQAALPSTPAATQAMVTPIEISNGTGIYIKNAEGTYLPGLSGGVLEASDAALDLSAESLEPAVGQYVFMAPSTTRVLTLPTAGVGKGFEITICNTDDADKMTVKASGGNTIRDIFPGQRVVFIALADTPTTGAHWWNSPGLLHRDITAVNRTTVGTFMSYTIPADTLKGDGQTLRITAWGNITNTGTSAIQVRFAASALATLPSVSLSVGWRIEILYVRTGASTQDVYVHGVTLLAGGWDSGSSASEGKFIEEFTTDAENTAADIAFDLRLSSAASIDIDQEGLLVELLA